MANIVNDEYTKILNSYTNIFDFNRYDRLSYDLQNKKIADIASDEHIVNNEFYRNYGTYRHDILSEDRLVKQNETYFDNNELDDYYYDTSSFILYKNNSKNKDIQKDVNANLFSVFSGCVLNKKYMTNINEASLEDIFAEYGYDYLKAVNNKFRNTEDFDGNYYFDKADPDNNIIADSYEIMPIGYEYINIDKERQNPDVEDRQETVEYDGTYVPTVQELLSGELYIVIKSGNLPCRKIYFNNKYMPTLFINDDKLLSKQDQYIINDQQPLKLCDLTLYQKLGCIIKWYILFAINKISIQSIINNLKQYDINDGSIILVTYYKAYYEVEGVNKVNSEKLQDEYTPKTESESTVFISGSSEISGFSSNATNITDIKLDSITQEPFFTNENNNNIINVYTPNINISTEYNEAIIHVHIKAAYALKIKGYINKPKYSLYWYKIVQVQ